MPHPTQSGRQLKPARPTIDDVAEAAGVSVATVSRALRQRPHVAEATRDRVMAAVRELGYEPHVAAVSLASGRTATVGLVAPYFGIWYSNQVISGVEAALSAAGYDLLIYCVDTPASRTRFLERAHYLDARIDGLVLVDFFPSPSGLEFEQLLGARVPIVSIGSELAGHTSLVVDNVGASRSGVEHLIELGHERIALVGASGRSEQSPVLASRRLGYQQAMEAAGLTPDSQLVVGDGVSVETGSRAAAAILALDEPPTAAFCLSDETAIGLLGRALELDTHVPSDLSVMGFDDHDIAGALGLTTVRQPVRRIGERAAASLLDALDGTLEHPRTELIEGDLVVRSTTAPIGGWPRSEPVAKLGTRTL